MFRARKLSVMLVSRMLMPELKLKKSDISKTLRTRFQAKEFPPQISKSEWNLISPNRTWIKDSKRKKNWKISGSPWPPKFKQAVFVGQGDGFCFFSFFFFLFISEGVIMRDYLERWKLLMDSTICHFILSSILLYGCTTRTLTKRLEKRLDGKYTRMLEKYWTSHGGNTPQSTKYTATYLPSRKLSKLDEPDMQDTAGEAGKSS